MSEEPPNAPPYHVYNCTTSREYDHVVNFLKEFKGIFLADVYQAYEKIESCRDDVVAAGHMGKRQIV